MMPLPLRRLTDGFLQMKLKRFDELERKVIGVERRQVSFLSSAVR